jgi:predicted ATPase/class 3 adenylate cyclase
LTDDQHLVRRLAAILAADVVGYTRLMGEDEAGTLQHLNLVWAAIFNPAVVRYRGRIVKTMGDGALVEFSSVVDAVTCAVAIQSAMAGRNTMTQERGHIEFRIGVNLGEIVIQGDDIFGDGVNVAARLEGQAPKGGVLISDLVNAQVKGKIDATFVDAGEVSLKNVDQPLRVWRWGEVETLAAPGTTIRIGETAVVEAPSAAQAQARQGNLPAVLPALYGRDDDIDALRVLIDGQRVVSIVGAGGIGKTRLAQAVAHAMRDAFADGAWMVELAPLADPALLPAAVAQALDIKLAGVSATLDELVVGMAQRTLLLVLDNCEHLLDAVAALVQAVMQGAPSLTLLLTSQEPLHLPAEQQYRVTPLAVPFEMAVSGAREFGAVALFVARVKAVDQRFALDDASLALVIDICRRLDGLPLAIELAAARTATLGLRPVRDKLDARFKLLTGGSRASLRRHQTLRATLDWSYKLLSDAEQAVFQRLGVFVGGFTVELAQAVAGDAQLDEWAVLDHLSALVDKSLVVADAGEVPRYRLLESARAFALE